MVILKPHAVESRLKKKQLTSITKHIRLPKK